MNIDAKKLYPLSSAQEMVYLEQLVRPNSAHLNVGSLMRLEGDIDRVAIESAVWQLVTKWPALTTQIVKNDQGVWQRFTPLTELPLTIVDCSDEADPFAAASAMIQQQVDQQTALDGEVLWRVIVVQVTEQLVEMGLIFHHIVIDAVAFALMLRDFFEFYNHASQSLPITVEQDASYLGFIEDSCAYQQSQFYQRDQQYWLNEFPSLPDAILPRASHDLQQLERGITDIRKIDRAFYQQLLACLAEAGLSAQSYFLAVVASYLYNRFGVPELVIGFPLHNRNNASYKNTVGMFAVTKPLRIEIDGNARFAQLVSDISKQLKRA